MKTIARLLTILLTLPTFALASAGNSSVELDQNIKASKKVERFNFRIEPHWLALGDAVLDFQFRLGKHFSIGPRISYMGSGDGVFSGGEVSDILFTDDQTRRIGYGLRAAYYLKGMNSNSLFISLAASRSDNTVTYEESSSSFTQQAGEGTFSENEASLSVGYHWKVKFITFNVGAGVAVYDTPDSFELTNNDGSITTRDLSDRSTGLNIDAGIGFTF